MEFAGKLASLMDKILPDGANSSYGNKNIPLNQWGRPDLTEDHFASLIYGDAQRDKEADRAMATGIWQMMLGGQISGEGVNNLISTGQLSDNVIRMLYDVHDPGAYAGTDNQGFRANWDRALGINRS